MWSGGSSSRYSSHGESRWREQRQTERERRVKKNDSTEACEDETFTVKRCLWRKKKSPLTLLKADLKTRLLCQTVEQTVLLFFAHFFPPPSPSPESTALSKSPPDFQLLSLVVVPDKQNLLDQADFTAAPAHMAASVAQSLSWGFFFSFFLPPLHTLLYVWNSLSLQIPTQFSLPIINPVLERLYFGSLALWRKEGKERGRISSV